MAPIRPGLSGGSGKRSLGTRRKILRVRRLDARGAPGRKIKKAANAAAISINRSQNQGTMGPRTRRTLRRTIRNLGDHPGARVSLKAASVSSRPTIGSGIGTGIKAGQGQPGKGQGTVPKKNPQHNRPSPGLPKKHHHPNKNSGDPGRPKRPKVKKHPHNDGPRKGNGPHKGKNNGPGKPKNKPDKPIKMGPAGRKLRKRLENITEDRYWQASDPRLDNAIQDFRQRRKYIKKHTKGKEKERKRIQIARKNLIDDAKTRGIGADKLHRKAGLAVGAELDPQLKALTSRIKQERRIGRRTQKDLRGIYKVAGEEHQSNRQKQREGTEQDISETQAAYGNLIDKLSSDYGVAKSTVTDEMDRLGINVPTATSGLSRDEEYSKGQAQLSRTEAVSGLRSDAGAASDLMALLGGEMTAQGLGARTTARQTTADAISSMRDQRSALAATRLGKIATAIEAIKAANRSAKSEALQNRLSMKLANQQFGLDVAKFKSDRQLNKLRLKLDARNQRFDNLLDLKKYGLDKAKFFADNMGGKTRKGKREYSNSRAGAVDFLKDRGLKGGGVDGYLNLMNYAHQISKLNGFMNAPKGHNNEMVKFIVQQLNKKGVPPKLTRAYGTALKIEWGLI